jgi:hypothetical protein
MDDGKDSMSAHGIPLESNRSDNAASMRRRRPVPSPGDILASERTARADIYAISVVPAPAHTVAGRYPEAIEKVRELARQLGVDGWYTGDQTHYAQVARYRAASGQ